MGDVDRDRIGDGERRLLIGSFINRSYSIERDHRSFYSHVMHRHNVR